MLQVADVVRGRGGEEVGDDVAPCGIPLGLVEVFPVARFAGEDGHVRLLVGQCAVQLPDEACHLAVLPAAAFLSAVPVVLRLVDGRQVGDGIARVQVVLRHGGEVVGEVVVGILLQVGTGAAGREPFAVARELHRGRIAEEDERGAAHVLGTLHEVLLSAAVVPVILTRAGEEGGGAACLVVDAAGVSLCGCAATEVDPPLGEADAFGSAVGDVRGEEQFADGVTLTRPVLPHVVRRPAVGGSEAAHRLVGGAGVDADCLLHADEVGLLRRVGGEGRVAVRAPGEEGGRDAE